MSKKSKRDKNKSSSHWKLLSADFAASEPNFAVIAMRRPTAWNAIQAGETPVFPLRQKEEIVYADVLCEDGTVRTEPRSWVESDAPEVAAHNTKAEKAQNEWLKEAGQMCQLINKHLHSDVKEEMKKLIGGS